MMQVGRNLTDPLDGFVRGKRLLLLDRDKKFTTEFRDLLKHAGTDASCPRIQTNSRLARRAVSIVIAPWRAPDLGRVGGDVGDSGSPYA